MADTGQEREVGALMATLDAFLFGFAGLSALWLGYLVFRESLRPNWQLLLLVVFYLLVAYLLLPRLHRVLTYLYLPGYFIGRARTSDGLLGDPVNVALLGEEQQIHTALQDAGWTIADDVSVASGVKIVRTTVSRKSYPEAPVSPLHLFDRPQDFAYQQEVEGNPAKRHHVRFWRCPEGWMLPGGHPVDWVAAGSYDRTVGMSLLTFQVTHRISGDIDAERDHIVETMTKANPDLLVDVIRNFSTGYHARNGGGDAISTDGDLPVVNVRSLVGTEAPAAAPTDSRDKRPAPTVFGAGVAFLRGVYTVLLTLVAAVSVLVAPNSPNITLTGPIADHPALVALVVVLVGVVFGGVDIALGLATYFGRNWSRVLLMLICVITIIVAFGTEVSGGPRPTLGAGLPVIGLSILMLLALTSHRSRHYALRARHAPGPVAARAQDRAAV